MEKYNKDKYACFTDFELCVIRRAFIESSYEFQMGDNDYSNEEK